MQGDGRDSGNHGARAQALNSLIQDEKKSSAVSTYEAVIQVINNLGLDLSLVKTWTSSISRNSIDVTNISQEDLPLKEKIRIVLLVAGSVTF